MSKRELDEARKEECRRLKAVFNQKKKELGLTQEKLAHLLDINQSSVSHYLNGVNPLNPQVAADMARILDIPVSAFSERLARQIDGLVGASSKASAYGKAPVASGFEVMETGGTYRLPEGMRILPAECPVDLHTASKVGAKAMAEVLVEGQKDADHLEQLAREIPLTLRIRHAKEVLSPMEGEKAEDMIKSFVGVFHNAREVLDLVDSVLEAAAHSAIDLEEIEAITTLVKKRRNEKVRGKGLPRDEKPAR